MSSWKDDSRFAQYIRSHPSFFTLDFVQPPTLALGASILADNDDPLRQATEVLHQLLDQQSDNARLPQITRKILSLIQDIQTCSATMKSEQLFERLQPLREWLFWTPVTLLRSDDTDESDLFLLVQLYTVALSIDLSVPELRGAALGSLTLKPLERIKRELESKHVVGSYGKPHASKFDALRSLSHQMSAKYQYRHSPSNHPSPAQASGRDSPYGFQNLSLNSKPGTPTFAPSFSTLSNHSLEDLSVPSSPYLRHDTPASRRHSQFVDVPNRPHAVTNENRSVSAYSFRGDSPVQSPRFGSEEQCSLPRHFFSDHAKGFVASSASWA